MGFCRNLLASLLAFVALVAVLVKGFVLEKGTQVFAVIEQATAYGSNEQAGFAIQRGLALNH